MRKVYETPEHRAAERIFAKDIARKWRLKYRRAPSMAKYDYDFLNRNGDVVVRVEMKVRDCTFDYYDTILVSGDKLINAADAAQEMGLLHILAVRYKDRDVYCNVNTILVRQSRFKLGGRYDRDDPLDETIVALIPKDNFKEFENIIWC
jgi:hypothetical protein